MEPEDYQKVKRIFQSAIELPAEEREVFLDEECRGEDEGLRPEVEKLLKAEDTRFMEEPAVAKMAEDIIDEESENGPTPTYEPKIGEQIGQYKILSKIGEGGMGKVFLASDNRLNRQVAVKLLASPNTYDPDRMRRFEQEAFAVSALNHPNILTIHDIGQTDQGIRYMVTEYVKGETLDEYCKRPDLDLSDKLSIAIQLASALSAAHSAEIIHRDIKPENTIVRPDGVIKVLDFGLAKLAAEGKTGESEAATLPLVKTSTGVIMGSIPYISPEQANGKKVDARTDIWSLGVVLYEMVSGRRPFRGDTPIETLSEITKKNPPSLETIFTGIPHELSWIVNKTLSKDPDGRYETAKGLAKDLERVRTRIEVDHEIQRTEFAGGDWTTATLKAPEYSSRPLPKSIGFLALALVLIVSAVGLYTFGDWTVSDDMAGAADSNLSSSTAEPAGAGSSRTSATNLEIPFFLMVQKMRNGKPFEEPFRSSGREIFETGYKFQMVFENLPAGFLYLFNEGSKDESGKGTFNILFPTPDRNEGLAEVKENQRLETSSNTFTSSKGTEYIWLIWTKEMQAELEAATRTAFANQGTVAERKRAEDLREFINNHDSPETKAEKDTSGQTTIVKGTGDVVIYKIELEHR